MNFQYRPYLKQTLLLLALLLVPALASALSPQEAVARFISTPRLPQGSMAVLVSELPTGKIIASHNAETPLVPASIMKCISLASLSEVAELDLPLTTPIFIDGEIDDEGILHGNIVVVGQGDPSVNSRIWPIGEEITEEILQALRAAGVKGVEGGIVVNEDFLAGPSIPASWASGDLPHSYGTGSHAFNYANNSVGKSSVKYPAAAFRADLRRRLNGAGISVGDTPVKGSERRPLLVHSSPELKEILRSCMMRSDNLYAETSLRLFGKAEGGDGSTSDAARRETNFWKSRNTPMEGVTIIDGSGLSRSNRLTPRFMESVLRQKSDDVEYASFFPLAGQEGTLKKFLVDTPLDSYIALKTGSMNGIQCYAGYKLDDNFAPTHVVIIMVNDFRCDRAYLRSHIEKMLLEIFSDENMTDKTMSTPLKGIQDYAE